MAVFHILTSVSPARRVGYSPAPRDRERDNYRQRSPSPPRRDIRDNRDNFRQRSPSPRRDSRDSRPIFNRRSPSPLRHSGPASGATSRRSSPPIHASRLRQVPLDERSPRASPRAPPLDRGYNNDTRSPYASPPREPREQERERGHPANSGGVPTGPRSTTLRAPPTGPAGGRNFTSPGNYASSTAMSPPTGPAASVTPISAHSRAPPVAPAGPRGGFRGSFRGGFGGRGGFEGGRGGFGGGRGGFARGPDENSFTQQEYTNRRSSEAFNNPRAAPFSAGVPNAPSGPRASAGGPPTGPAGFRGGPVSQQPRQTNENGNGSATYPKTQRFLNDLPQAVPGGRKIPVKAPPNAAKVKRLEEDAERLRRIIDEKERVKTAKLKEWERLEAECDSAKLRTELAEEGLRKIEMMEV